MVLRGIYAANTAMVSQQLKEAVISQNLANLNTAGYKADAVAFRSFPEVLLWRLEGYREEAIGTASLGLAVGAMQTDHGEGPLLFTGRPLDVAIAGNGYFVVQDLQGNVFYTRSGAFNPNGEGYLVNEQGYYVLGEGGALWIGTADASILEDGTVMVGTEAVGRLLVVDFADRRALAKAGDNLFRLAGETGAGVVRPTLRSGYLEQANVDAVRSMVELLSAFRAYEAAQRALRAQDELLARAAGEVGVLR
jgi:flagellar basal-body rod protein FlgG